MRFKSKRKKAFIFSIIIFIGLFTFFKWQNNSITINEILFENNKIPEEFNGYKILQISDLHNKEFGDKHNKIIDKIKNINPDIIVVTGDLIDSNKTNIDIAIGLMSKLMHFAPIYYVSGNHEAWSGSYDILKAKLEEVGVRVLDNEKIELAKGNSSIELIGLADPSFPQKDNLEKILNNLTETNPNFKILLSHRPELFDIYCNSEADLVFSGHAHGGQFRLPFVGGLVAPDQGLFPEFTEGIHTKDNTSMIVSRGLGNSIIPIRVFNRPELIVTTLLK